MQRTDFDAFSELLDAVCSLLSRGAYQPNPTNTALFFRSLADHDIARVRAGFDAHVRHPKNGRFVPTPADILDNIAEALADDGRPGAEEAWALAMRATNEADTVVWTVEVAEALDIVRPILVAGDEVGARMAFKESYGRLVDNARKQRRAAEWSASEGFDLELRVQALKTAAARGLLPASAVPQLAAPRGEVLLLTQAGQESAPESARAALLALKNSILTRAEVESADAATKATTEALRKAMAEKVNRYEEGSK